MKTEAQLNHRIRSAHGFFRELIDLAETQGWTCRVKEEGLLFFAPADKRRPGMESVYARDPGNESHLQRQIRERFRKAGLTFPEDQPPERKPKQAMNVNTTPAAFTPSPPNAFAQIRQKINATVTLLSEIEQLLVKVEADSAKVNDIKELLRGLAT